MQLRLNQTEYPSRRVDEAPIIDDGLLYEPRALWDVVRIDTSVDQDPDNPFRSTRTVRLDPTNWYNGSKHTYVFTKLLMSPVNYNLQQFAGTVVPPAALIDFNNCGSAVNRMQVVINAPRRQRMADHPLIRAAYVPQPTMTPSMEFTATPYASSLLGLSRWTFDKAMRLPTTGSCRFDISNIPPSLLAPAGLQTPVVSAAFFEQYAAGGWAMRHARTLNETPNFLPSSLPDNPWPAGSQSFASDAFVNNPGNQSSNWGQGGALTANIFRRQEANRGGENNWIQGFGVLLDQVGWDDAYQALGVVNVPGSPITPLSQRLGCRARTTNGGTNQWWWRQNAPLALVCPTITPAQVMELEQPIKLGPGDSLEVEVTAPNPVALVPQLDPVFQFGVSLTGYAIVEG